MELAIALAGLRKAVRAMTFLAAWGIASEFHNPGVRTGRLTMEGYAAYWRMSTASAYRDRQAWEAVFPGLSVDEVWSVARDMVEVRQESREKLTLVAEVGQLPAGELGLAV